MSFGTSISPLTRADSLDEIEMPIAQSIPFAINYAKGLSTGYAPITTFQADEDTLNMANTTIAQISLLSVEKINDISASLGLNLPNDLFKLDTSYEKRSSYNKVHLLAWAKREIASVHKTIDEGTEIDLKVLAEGKYGTHYLYEKRWKTGYCYVVTLVAKDVRSAQAIKASFREPKTSVGVSGELKRVMQNNVSHIDVQLYSHHLINPKLDPVDKNIEHLWGNIEKLNEALQGVKIGPVKKTEPTTLKDSSALLVAPTSVSDNTSNIADIKQLLIKLLGGKIDNPAGTTSVLNDETIYSGISSGVYVNYWRLPDIFKKLKQLGLSETDFKVAKLVKAMSKEAMILLDKYLSFYENSKFKIIQELKKLRNDLESYNAQLVIFYWQDKPQELLEKLKKKVSSACDRVQNKCKILNDHLTEGRLYNILHQDDTLNDSWIGYGGKNCYWRATLGKLDSDTADCRFFNVSYSKKSDPIINTKSMVNLNFSGYKLPGASLFLHRRKWQNFGLINPILELKEKSFEQLETASERYVFKLEFNKNLEDTCQSNTNVTDATSKTGNDDNSKFSDLVRSASALFASSARAYASLSKSGGEAGPVLEGAVLVNNDSDDSSEQQKPSTMEPDSKLVQLDKAIAEEKSLLRSEGSSKKTNGDNSDVSSDEKEFDELEIEICMVANEEEMERDLDTESVVKLAEDHKLTFVQIKSIDSALKEEKQVVFKGNHLKLVEPSKANSTNSTFIFMLDKNDPLYQAYKDFRCNRKMIEDYLSKKPAGTKGISHKFKVSIPKDLSKLVDKTVETALPAACFSSPDSAVDFNREAIKADGHCLFYSVIKGLINLGIIPDGPKDVMRLRKYVSDTLMANSNKYFENIKAMMASILEEIDNGKVIPGASQEFENVLAEIIEKYQQYKTDRKLLNFQIAESIKFNQNKNKGLQQVLAASQNLEEKWTETFENFMNTKGYQAYCNEIGKKLWGAEVELEVMANEFNVCIAVYKANSGPGLGQYSMGSADGKSKVIWNQTNVNEAAEQVIHILNVENYHYDLLNITEHGCKHYETQKARIAAPRSSASSIEVPDSTGSSTVFAKGALASSQVNAGSKRPRLISAGDPLVVPMSST